MAWFIHVKTNLIKTQFMTSIKNMNLNEMESGVWSKLAVAKYKSKKHLHSLNCCNNIINFHFTFLLLHKCKQDTRAEYMRKILMRYILREAL